MPLLHVCGHCRVLNPVPAPWRGLGCAPPSPFGPGGRALYPSGPCARLGDESAWDVLVRPHACAWERPRALRCFWPTDPVIPRESQCFTRCSLCNGRSTVWALRATAVRVQLPWSRAAKEAQGPSKAKLHDVDNRLADCVHEPSVLCTMTMALCAHGTFPWGRRRSVTATLVDARSGHCRAVRLTGCRWPTAARC